MQCGIVLKNMGILQVKSQLNDVLRKKNVIVLGGILYHRKWDSERYCPLMQKRFQNSVKNSVRKDIEVIEVQLNVESKTRNEKR